MVVFIALWSLPVFSIARTIWLRLALQRTAAALGFQTRMDARSRNLSGTWQGIDVEISQTVHGEGKGQRWGAVEARARLPVGAPLSAAEQEGPTLEPISVVDGWVTVTLSKPLHYRELPSLLDALVRTARRAAVHPGTAST